MPDFQSKADHFSDQADFIIVSYDFCLQSSTGFALYMIVPTAMKAIIVLLLLSSTLNAQVRKMLHIVKNWLPIRCSSTRMMVKTCFLIKNISRSRLIGSSENAIFASFNTIGQDSKPWNH